MNITMNDLWAAAAQGKEDELIELANGPDNAETRAKAAHFRKERERLEQDMMAVLAMLVTKNHKKN